MLSDVTALGGAERGEERDLSQHLLMDLTPALLAPPVLAHPFGRRVGADYAARSASACS